MRSLLYISQDTYYTSQRRWIKLPFKIWGNPSLYLTKKKLNGNKQLQIVNKKYSDHKLYHSFDSVSLIAALQCIQLVRQGWKGRSEEGKRLFWLTGSQVSFEFSDQLEFRLIKGKEWEKICKFPNRSRHGMVQMWDIRTNPLQECAQ